MVDWEKILSQYHIEWINAGKSTAKGNLYVKCPWCGDNDQGHHLGISLSKPWRGFGCWKQRNHRGKSPVRLLAALLNVPWERAASIISQESGIDLVADGDLSTRLQLMLRGKNSSESPSTTPVGKLTYPTAIKSLGEYQNFSTSIFREYLRNRGYTSRQVGEICTQYKLHYALHGPYAYRIIFPIYTEIGLTTWTGRTITSHKEPRYLTLTSNPDVAGSGPCALANIKDCLFNEQWLFQNRGSALIVCEGPFDAMRFDYVGQSYNVYSTGLFGKTISDIQLQKLEALGESYERVFILLDPDAAMDNFAMWNRVASAKFTILKQPGPWDDPGDMPIEAIKQFIEERVLT